MFGIGRHYNMKIECFVCVIQFLITTLAFARDLKSCSSINRAIFPSSFLFGSSSSAYQYEGAAAIDGKGPSIWDTYTQKFPDRIKDHKNGSIAVDQYHRYKEDVAIMKDIGFDAYRFSISWSRVLPQGHLGGGVNQQGIDYYNNLINELLSNGVQPVVTLFHWDLPQALETKYKGFLSTKIVVDFQAYAELCFEKFGDRVKHWITLNEPLNYAFAGYSLGVYAPVRCSNRSTCQEGDSGIEPYIVSHNQLLAHAAAVKVYKEKHQATQKGEIGMALNAAWMIPYSNSTQDKLAATRALAFQFDWFMRPLYSGAYPKEMIDNVGNRLPKFSQEESTLVKGSYDFIGINYYTSNYAADIPPQTQNFTLDSDSCANLTSERNGIPIGPKNTDWLYVYPEGLLNLLVYTKDTYNSPKIYIMENGMGDPKETAGSVYLEDTSREEFYQDHIEKVHTAMQQGVNVNGYMAWSLLDNFEWIAGFTTRFGIVHVDYDHGLQRSLKNSAKWFKQFLHSNCSSN
ncbi:beta glucosidase 12 [Euphorbia peplus]|nr:beta glucosidase 12 [Euphorbia peplus]